MALGSTQPPTEMITRSISWGKGGRCVRLTTLPPSCAVVMKSGNLNFLEPSGPLQACKESALTFLILLLDCNYRLFIKYYTTFLEAATLTTLEYSGIYCRIEYKIAIDISEN